ncbi:MAG: hypothetical protein RIA62_12595 [Cyclobacteriaceae bacterium]|uniref:hypothetical protein n=1 Tax=Fulvivirga sp. TaxID=1931237 RepID=UPI0032EF6B48
MRSVNKNQFFDLLKEQTHPVTLDSIPEALHEEIERFMFGKTVIKINGSIAFYPGDYNDWIAKIKTEGLSYDIQLI